MAHQFHSNWFCCRIPRQTSMIAISSTFLSQCLKSLAVKNLANWTDIDLADGPPPEDTAFQWPLQPHFSPSQFWSTLVQRHGTDQHPASQLSYCIDWMMPATWKMGSSSAISILFSIATLSPPPPLSFQGLAFKLIWAEFCCPVCRWLVDSNSSGAHHSGLLPTEAIDCNFGNGKESWATDCYLTFSYLNTSCTSCTPFTLFIALYNYE